MVTAAILLRTVVYKIQPHPGVGDSVSHLSWIISLILFTSLSLYHQSQQCGAVHMQ